MLPFISFQLASDNCNEIFNEINNFCKESGDIKLVDELCANSNEIVPVNAFDISKYFFHCSKISFHKVGSATLSLFEYYHIIPILSSNVRIF